MLWTSEKHLKFSREHPTLSPFLHLFGGFLVGGVVPQLPRPLNYIGFVALAILGIYFFIDTLIWLHKSNKEFTKIWEDHTRED